MSTNDLINEKSPYLLQHAHNPVNWMPWGDAAFEKAKKEDKPIFLSIGYSTCHWCHVMEKESFEDEETAKKLNDTFVCIKVDREERPDIDSIYMTVCQMLTGGGGWPLSIFMTPDKHAFFAGTYFPRESKYGRQGLIEITDRIDLLWKEQRDKIMESASSISDQLSRDIHAYTENMPGQDILDEAYEALAQRFDTENGGFGGAPKFPVPSNLLYLIRYYSNKNKEFAYEMVKRTLDEMRKGGIYDHAGFGFHRYSTDEKWLVPHFEKMLYDQALISQAYIEAYQAKFENSFRETAEEIFQYILRDMTDDQGAFYSAEDADSEGVEGKFYVWTYEEIHDILGDEAELFCDAYDVQRAGNFFDNFETEPLGNNILHFPKSMEDLISKYELPESELKNKLRSYLDKLFEEREKRVRPGLDDKILTDWNGLMIASLAMGGKAFGNKTYIETAEKAADFILQKMLTKEGHLLHRYRDGDAAIDGIIDDYAFFIHGLLELYQASFKTKYLREAINLESKAKELFFDESGGGYYMSPSSSKDLIARKKEIYDSATPSGNSMMLMNLLKLWKMTGKSKYQETAEKTIKKFIQTVESAPGIFTHFLSALHILLSRSVEIVVVGDREKSLNVLERIKDINPWNQFVLLKSEEDKKEIEKIAPFTENMAAGENKPAFYVCRDFACSQPTTDINEAIENIKGKNQWISS